jgi:hypothetical protein
MDELQIIEAEIVGQRGLFDYSALDAETRIVAQQRAVEIRSIAKRVAGDVVEIGHKLADVKQRLGGNGKFNDWLEAELGWSERTAHNFIGVYSKFGAANFALENVAVSALYLLAAPSTPAEAVEVAKQIADSGEKVTHKVAKEVVRQAKARKPKQVELIEEPEEIEEAAAPEGETASEESEAAEVGTCRVCGCTDADCRQCIEKTGEPCYWVEDDLCSACAPASQKLPPGWRWEITNQGARGFRAGTEDGNLRTMIFPTEAEAIRSAHEIVAAEEEGLLGLTGRGLTSKGAAAKPEAAPASALAPERPAAWFKTRIEITITLMPGGDAATRKVMHSVRAGEEKDDFPFVEITTGEEDLVGSLPVTTLRCFEKASAAFAKKQASKHAKKPTTKSKPAAKKPTAKSKARGGKK